MLGMIPYMAYDIANWKTQIRKGYLELCILSLINRDSRLYGFDILAKLETAELFVKEGTLYPLLNRMTLEGLLSSAWETENVKGHPRKFYSLTKAGRHVLDEMGAEFNEMHRIYKKLEKESQ